MGRGIILTLLISVSAQAKGPCQDLLTAPSQPPLVAQCTDYTCGPATLLSWLKSVGDDSWTEEDLSAALNTTKENGTEFSDFMSGIHSIGYTSATIARPDFDDLKFYMDHEVGIILNISHEGEGHWVLLTKVHDDITLMDPWVAREGKYRTISKENLEKIWFNFIDGRRLERSVILISK